jgi:Winged helix-turn-helix DNA-binding
MIGVRVLADGSDDEFFGGHDDAENDVASVRPNDFLGSLKRPKSKKVYPAKTLPSAVRSRRGSVLRHRSEQDEQSITTDNPEGWVAVVERASVGNPDPTRAEVLFRLIYRPPSPRQAERETLEDVAQFMRAGNWQGVHSYMTRGHPDLYDYSQARDRWYIDAEGYVRRDHSRASMSPANPDITAQARAMVEKGLDQIPAPLRTFVWKKGKREEVFPAQHLAMEKVYALLGRELVEPIPRADRQARLRAAVLGNPDLSVRELARQEGTSKSTIHRLRKRLEEGGVPLEGQLLR